jgi:YegS/Rv2252/BmrU family lipid kinase
LSSKAAHAIVNPASGNGRTRREWPRLLELLQARLGPVSWEWTEGPGHATRLALQALLKGCDRIWSVGGDGTHHEVANAFVGPNGPLFPHAVLAPLSRGTGSDLAKSLCIPKEPEAALDALARGLVASLDVGWIRYQDPKGEEHGEAFLNITSMGIGGEVDIRVNRSSKVLGGFISFLWATLATLLTYQAKTVRFSVDGGAWREEKIMIVAVANGQYFGGGMWIAPPARPDDGAFEVVLVREMGRLALVGQLGRLYKGTHLSHPKVEAFQARGLMADSRDLVWLDVDGEPLGSLPVEFRILPGALRVVVGPGFSFTGKGAGEGA